jgi:hypothetical protein
MKTSPSKSPTVVASRTLSGTQADLPRQGGSVRARERRWRSRRFGGGYTTVRRLRDDRAPPLPREELMRSAVPGGNCQVVVASQQSPSIYAERRTNPRQPITKKAVVRLKRYSVVCTVRDFSPAGVGLTLSDTITLPAEFDLTLDRATRHCLTVWRQLDRVGVKWSP